ncbi:hypothetical protein Tco_0094264, partial [Tanacetum coccineum]
EEMFDVNVLDGEEVFVAEQEVAANKENNKVNVVEEVVQVSATISAATTTTSDDGDINLAQALIEMKSTKPKNKEKRAGTEQEHSLRMQHMQIYMLVEKKYPLTPLTLLMMLEKKIIIDYESEMAYQLLKFIIKQLKK